MSRLMVAVGSALRLAGKALDGLGSNVQGKYAYIEKLVPSLALASFDSEKPMIGNEVFIAPNATVMGKVQVGDKASVWYGTVIRGDVNSVRIGHHTNLQDNVVVHVAKHGIPPTPPRPTVIGNNVTIGHGAVLHACSIADGCLVGMGATLLDGVQMHENSIVAAGSLVPPNTMIGTGQLWAGSPAKLLRQLTTEEMNFIIASANSYAELAALHLEENSKTFDQIIFDNNMRKDRLLRSPDYDSHQGILRDEKTREIKYMAPI